jgi:peptidoglycan/LPS O-acetylase OafA/YrhL
VPGWVADVLRLAVEGLIYHTYWRRMLKIKSIEGLRGLLALWVVLVHTLLASGLGLQWRGPFKVLANGAHPVDAFIIVSGFVIFFLLDSARESYGHFMWRRFLRLYPVYLVCLIASIFFLRSEISAYAIAPWPHPWTASRVEIAQNSLAYLPQQTLAHLFMAQSIIPYSLLPSSNFAILGQAWSLSLEWQFYVLAPLMFVAFSKSPRAAIAVILVSSAVHFLITGGPDGFLPRHVPFFALGIASYYLWRASWRPDWPLLLPTGVALAYLLTHDAAIVIWLAVFLAAYQPGVWAGRFVTGLLERPAVLMLGRLSYSVYLSHMLILCLAMLVLERAEASRMGQWPYFALLLLITLAGTIPLSWGLHRFIEVPCIAMGKRNARELGQRAPAPAE